MPTRDETYLNNYWHPVHGVLARRLAAVAARRTSPGLTRALRNRQRAALLEAANA